MSRTPSKHCLHRNSRGAAIPEFVISIGFFLFLTSMVIDILYLGYRVSVVNYLANEGIRSVTMQLKEGEEIEGTEGKDAVAMKTVKEFIADRGKAFGLNMSTTNVIVNSVLPASKAEACTEGPSVGAGNPKRFVSVCVKVPLTLLFNSIKYDYGVFRVGRNEPSIGIKMPS